MASLKFLGVLGLIFFIVVTAVDGAGECGKSSPDNEAMKLAPCAGAAQDANSVVPRGCCTQIRQLSQNPKCLCAILLSDTAKGAGVDPETALTIPKRCKFDNRPVGYKCGPYTLP